MAKQELPTEFEQIHRMIGRAMREVDRGMWPPRPHLGGPLPMLGWATQLQLAIDVGELARDIATRDELKRYDELVAVARGIAKSTKGDDRMVHYKNLDALSKSKKSDSSAIQIAKLVARTGVNFRYASQSAQNAIGKCVENAVVAAARHYSQGVSAAATRTFLVAVDDAIMRRELSAALAERSFVPSSPIAQVVSRPRGKTKGLALVMARLADNSYGLFVKLKQRWQWHEGDRDSMFATVPDEFMRSVAADIDPDFKRTRA